MKHQWKCQRDLIMANSKEDYETQGPFEVVFLLWSIWIMCIWYYNNEFLQYLSVMIHLYWESLFCNFFLAGALGSHKQETPS